MTLIEKVILAAIVALLIALCWASSKGVAEFRKVCEQSGGVTVFDGRQNQCIKQKT